MRLALIAGGLPLALDPLLIYGAGWGVTGAPTPTTTGRAVALEAGVVLRRRRGYRGSGGGAVRAVAVTGAPIAGTSCCGWAGPWRWSRWSAGPVMRRRSAIACRPPVMSAGVTLPERRAGRAACGSASSSRATGRSG